MPNMTNEEDSASLNSLTEVDKEFLDSIFQSLTHSCETAFRKGVDSADIYKTLQFHIRKAAEERTSALNKSNNDSNKSRRINWNRVSTFVHLLRKAFWTFVIISCSLVGVYWTACDYFNVNPLNVFPSALGISERRCFLPSNPLVMEMSRPIANCSICASDTGKVRANYLKMP
jgi:hypothetical protein